MGENTCANGHGNGVSSNGEASAMDKLCWSVALMNESGKYLSAEKFSFAVNASGKALKKHQVWTLVPDASEPDTFYLRSHLKRYITSDRNGNIKCVAESPSAEAKLIMERNDDSISSKWALKSVASGAYFGGLDDQLNCSGRKPAWWTVTMLLHPHMYMRKAARAKYAIMRDGELQCTENLPTSANCLVTLENHGNAVSIRAADRRFLQLDGSLAEEPALFRVELRAGATSGVAFRAEKNRCYLGSSGTKSTLKTLKNDTTCTKDEVFIIELSRPQLTFRVCSTSKYVSRRQTTDLSANQADLQDGAETFQLEYVDNGSGNPKWRLRDSENRMWSVTESGAVNLTNTEGEQTLFELHYDSQDRVALRAFNGKYVTTLKNGRLSATSNCTDLSAASDNELFWAALVNRNELVFQGEHGYVTLKNEKLGKLECNLTQSQLWSFEVQPNGAYRIGDEKSRYWKLCDDSSISVVSLQEADLFTLRFGPHNRVAVRARNGSCLKADQNGTLKANASCDDAHFWVI